MGKGDMGAARIQAESVANIGKEMTGMAKELWGETSPYRKLAGGTWSDIVKGGQSMQRAMAPAMNQATGQFGVGYNKIKNELPPGGLRDISMRDMRLSEAGAKTGMANAAWSDALTRLGAFSQFGTQSGIGAMGGAGNQFQGAGGMYTNLAQLGAQNAAGIGQGVGSLVAMM